MVFSSKKVLKAALLGLAMMLPLNVSLHAQQPKEAARQGEAAKPQTVINETDVYRYSPAVVKLGATLGMGRETAANVFTIFNIVVLFGFIGYGLAKILPKVFRARSSAIQKHLVDARTATEEASARLNSVEERLSKLDEQIAGMHGQAEQDFLREEQRIKARVEDEQKKIVAAAEAEIQTATMLARRDIQRYAAELAIEQAARKLVVTAETDRLLVQNFAARLGSGMDSGMGEGSKN